MAASVSNVSAFIVQVSDDDDDDDDDDGGTPSH